MPDFPERLFNLYKSPDYGLWFLWVLFLCHVCFYLVYLAQKYAVLGFVKTKIKETKFFNSYFIRIAAAIVVFVLVQYIPFNVLGVGLLKMHFPFFVTGFLAMKYKDYIVKWKNQLIPAAIIIYFLLFPYWEFSENGLYLSIVDGMGNHALQLSWDFLRFYRYAVSLSGIGVAMSLVYFMIKADPVEKFLSKLGQYTLEIYVSHQMLFGYGFGSNFVLKVITTYIDAIALSLGLGIILKRIPVIRTVLYGMPLKTEQKKAAQ
jgi:fucose 4-O-acetylase-like acetyltransferase